MKFAGALKALRRRAVLPPALACAAAAAVALCAGAVGARQDGNASPAGQAAGRINVWFDVTDKPGLQFKSLRPEDVRVSDDGVPQRIEMLELRPAATRSVVVVIDISGSQEHVLPAEKLIAQSLVARLVRPGRDRVAVVSFAGETTLEQEFTPDGALAQQAIDKLRVETPDSYIAGAILTGRDQTTAISTSLADALWLVGGEVFPAAPAGSRRVLVLITDGRDTSSQTKKRDAEARLFGAGATVFAIGVADTKNFEGVDKGGLKALAERTGGRAFFPKKNADVIAAFDAIEQSLGAQYLLSYAPAGVDPKGKSPRLKIEIVNPELRAQGLRVNHPERRPDATPPLPGK